MNPTPYHDKNGHLNFHPEKVTDRVWKAALAKWKYYVKHLQGNCIEFGTYKDQGEKMSKLELFWRKVQCFFMGHQPKEFATTPRSWVCNRCYEEVR
jgi:hypothetical protein